PERVQIAIRGVRTEHRPGGRGTLLLGVVVVLHPNPPEQRVQVVRNVSGGKNVGDTGPARCIDEDPIVDRDPRALRDLDVRLDADGDDHQIAVDRAACLMASQSATVRSWKMLASSEPGTTRRRFRPPVASSSFEYSTVRPESRVTVRVSVSIAVAVALIRSTSFLAYHSAGSTSQPDRSPSPRR